MKLKRTLPLIATSRFDSFTRPVRAGRRHHQLLGMSRCTLRVPRQQPCPPQAVLFLQFFAVEFMRPQLAVKSDSAFGRRTVRGAQRIARKLCTRWYIIGHLPNCSGFE
jgi:hypothetical protein